MTHFDDDLVSDEPAEPARDRGWVKIAAIVACGGCLVLVLALTTFFVLVGLAVDEGFVAGTDVSEARELRAEDREWMRTHFRLDDDESILWAYSRSFTFQLETSLVTDRRVAFQAATGFGEHLDMAYFEQIEALDVEWGESFEDTRVKVERRGDLDPFELWLSPEDGHDREVVAWLRERID